MICPVCNKDMVIVEYRDIELDYCPHCRGVWFDSGELELLLEAAGATGCRPFLDAMTARPEAQTGEAPRKCPVCLKKMKKVSTSDTGGVIVDICRNDDGIWFDHREVQHLADALAKQSPGGEDGSRLVLEFLNEVFKY